jgi:hypothetical protein
VPPEGVLMTVHSTPFSNTSNGVNSDHPAGLCTVNAKSYGGTGLSFRVVEQVRLLMYVIIRIASLVLLNYQGEPFLSFFPPHSSTQRVKDMWKF